MVLDRRISFQILGAKGLTGEQRDICLDVLICLKIIGLDIKYIPFRFLSIFLLKPSARLISDRSLSDYL